MQAVYEDGETVDISEPVCERLGDELCFNEDYVNSFCLYNDVEINDETIYSDDSKNGKFSCDGSNILSYQPCPDDSDKCYNYWNAENELDAKCVTANCNSCNSNYQIFGFNELGRSSIDVDGQNRDCSTLEYCYYDYYGANVYKYSDCAEINMDLGCYNYASKDACEKSECVPEECQWNELDNELGTAVCAPLDIDKQICELCNRGTLVDNDVQYDFSEIFNYNFFTCTIDNYKNFGQNCTVDDGVTVIDENTHIYTEDEKDTTNPMTSLNVRTPVEEITPEDFSFYARDVIDGAECAKGEPGCSGVDKTYLIFKKNDVVFYQVVLTPEDDILDSSDLAYALDLIKHQQYAEYQI